MIFLRWRRQTVDSDIFFYPLKLICMDVQHYKSSGVVRRKARRITLIIIVISGDHCYENFGLTLRVGDSRAVTYYGVSHSLRMTYNSFTSLLH